MHFDAGIQVELSWVWVERKTKTKTKKVEEEEEERITKSHIAPKLPSRKIYNFLAVTWIKRVRVARVYVARIKYEPKSKLFVAHRSVVSLCECITWYGNQAIVTSYVWITERKVYGKNEFKKRCSDFVFFCSLFSSFERINVQIIRSKMFGTHTNKLASVATATTTAATMKKDSTEKSN